MQGIAAAQAKYDSEIPPDEDAGMTEEEIAQADKEHAQWVAEIRLRPVFKDGARWDEVTARRLAE